MNTYRLGNLKRPAYAPPPDLSVSVTNNMAAIPEPIMPATAVPNSATIFTPIRDETDNRTTNTNNSLMNQTSSSNISSFHDSNNSTSDLSSNPTLPSYQSPVPSQAATATVLPPTDPPQLVSLNNLLFLYAL